MALILVTGASAGLGQATATTLATQGHDVVLHARSKDRLSDAKLLRPMRDVLFGDLSDLDQTAHLAERANIFGRFDAVIHNAGVLDGPEVLPVNVVTPFVLTALMIPPKRAIFLSSSMHRSGSARYGRLVLGGSTVTYSDSKLYVTALAMAVAHRFPGIMAHAVDPGWVPTRMGGRSAPDSLEESHRTQDWLATAPAGDITPSTGGYWHHRRQEQHHPAALDYGFQEDILDGLGELTGIAFPR